MSYLKDNRWMSILHKYAQGEQSDVRKWGNIFKMAGDRFVVHVSSAVWGGVGSIAVVKEYEIITLIYMLCLLWFGASEDIIHSLLESSL